MGTLFSLLWALASPAHAQCPEPIATSGDGSDIGLLAPAVVRVTVGAGSGTGVLVDPAGTILTAAHVAQAGPISVTLSSGLTLLATVGPTEPELDIAMLHVQGTGFPCLDLVGATPTIGQEVWAVGFPAGDFALSRGIVSALPERDGHRFVQTDTAVSPGNSGGPLVNSAGEIVGLLSWKWVGTGYEGMAYAVPADLLGAWMAGSPSGDGSDVMVGPGRPAAERLTALNSPLGVKTAAGDMLAVDEFALLVGQPAIAANVAKLKRQSALSWLYVGGGSIVLVGPGIYFTDRALGARTFTPPFNKAVLGASVSAVFGTAVLAHGIRVFKRSQHREYSDYYAQKGLQVLVDGYNAETPPAP